MLALAKKPRKKPTRQVINRRSAFPGPHHPKAKGKKRKPAHHKIKNKSVGGGGATAPKPRKRRGKPKSVFQRLHHHIYANLSNKIKEHIKHVMAPMSAFRQNLANKLSDTAGIIKKAFPTESGKHKAANALRQLLHPAGGKSGKPGNKPDKSHKPLLSDDHKAALYRILKAAGIAGVQTAAIASGTPLMFFATPELAGHVYEHWANEGRRNYEQFGQGEGQGGERGESGKGEDGESGGNKPEEVGSHLPTSQKHYSEYVNKMASLGRKPLGYTQWKNQLQQQAHALAAAIKTPKVPVGKFNIDLRKLSDDQLLAKFVTLLRAHLRSGEIPKQSIENSLRLHPQEFGGKNG